MEDVFRKLPRSIGYNPNSCSNSADISGEWVESVIIIIVVILNAILGVTQARKAESSIR